MRFVSVMLALTLAGVATAASAAPPAGIWANPKNSVRVAFRSCGRDMCGTVVWASEKAQADAQRGGTEKLVGTVLFDHFAEDGPHHWTGSVLVPDIGQKISGTITQTDPRTLVGEGCLFGTMGCKAQTWSRIK